MADKGGIVRRFTPADLVYVEREGKLEETDVVFKDDRHLLQIIERIVSVVGRRIDESSPMVDARLADGSRVNAIIAPLARVVHNGVGAADFAPIGWAPTISSRESPGPSRCSISCRRRSGAGST